MKQKIVYGIFIIAFVFTATQAMAKEWKLDANHSVVQFGITHIFSTVYGNFSDFNGDIRFDPANPGAGRFDFTVQVNSVNTGNAKRDNHLRSPDFFDAGKFPVMRFVSSGITHKGGKNYVVTGEMTLKNTTKVMEIPFVFHGTAPSPFDKRTQVAGFDTQFTLDRLAFGVGSGKFYDMGVVGKDVHVTISVEALGDK
ncbi:MAG TPA: polyisoprenoid-binding protein [Desulfobacteraceae bacterium]|nr:polyisoprenoid-binding protein [Desulfobacteraceae bacterium]|tara:strand:+ start:212 stop:802 length:591 start_codon:yes stop_codon:yes gene_type:complete